MGTSGSSKRGNLGLDGLYIIVGLFVFGLVLFLGYKLLSDFNTDVQGDADMAPQAKASIGDFKADFAPSFDQAFAALVGMLWVALLVTSYMIDSHPAFFVIVLLVTAFVLVVGMQLSNDFQDFASDAEIAQYAADFPIINWIMSNLLYVMVGMILTSGIAMYAKTQG